MDLERQAILTLATAVHRRRTTHGWTFDQLAALAGISKGAVVAVESGKTNPSLSTITRLADAFGVPIADLLGGTVQDRLRLIPHHDLVPLWHTPIGGKAVLIQTINDVNAVEVWEWSLGPNEVYTGTPHPAGTMETVTVVAGTLVLTVNEDVISIPESASAVFQADCPHAYTATDAGTKFLMTVCLRVSAGR